jgi:hypothetical protein
MKRRLVIVSAVTLMIFGFLAAYWSSVTLLASDSLLYLNIWWLAIKLSIPLFIISGVSLFFFREWARKLALLSFAIAIAHLGFCLIDSLFQYAGAPEDYITLAMIIISAIFIKILSVSKEEFRKTKPVIGHVIMISVLTLFSVLYLFVIYLDLKNLLE